MKSSARFIRLTAAAAALLMLSALPAAAGIDLNAKGRTEQDHDRDSYNKPIELIEFWGIEEGMTVMDLFPGNGYTTQLLSMAVGPKGKVLAYASYSHEKFEERMKPLGIKNIEETVIGYPDGFKTLDKHLKSIPDGSIDAILTIRNYHDLTNPEEVLVELRRILKPGGILGIADSRTTTGRDPDHCRIAEEVIIQEVTGAGFELAGVSQMLSNPKDDYSRSFWDARWIVDQACLKFIR